MEPRYITVSALTGYIKHRLEIDPHLRHILIKGEISNYTAHASGHLYFTLKDANAQISAIMFARAAKAMQFNPKAGDKVLIEGTISLFEARGTYSLSVNKMTLDGIGDLFLEYEKLKKEFQALGYFDALHKKEIPKFNSVIGVITSPTGAVIEDIKHTVERRFKLSKILLYPAIVQGEKAKDSIVEQIKKANQEKRVDVLIVGRGGGSIEDLWAFNEKVVVEAIFNSQIPIIAAIGHETDTTLADLVADLRAPTPTAAAEQATPHSQDLIDNIKEISRRNVYHIIDKINTYRQVVMSLEERLMVSSPFNKLLTYQQQLDNINKLLQNNFNLILQNKRYLVTSTKSLLVSPAQKLTLMRERINAAHQQIKTFINVQIEQKYQKLQFLRQQLINLNPLSIMDKGYSLTTKNNQVVTSIKQVNLDDNIELVLKDGVIKAVVLDKKDNDL